MNRIHVLGWVQSWVRGLLPGLMLGVGTLVAEPSFTAELEPDQVAAGEAATLKLTFTDFGDVAAPTLPALTNCTVQYQGVSRGFSFGTFGKSSSTVHQYAVQPKSAGTVSIPALTVELDGKQYASEPLTLHVGPGFDLSQIGFLKLSAPRPDVYVGETFPLEVRFYFRQAPARQAPPSLKLEGFLKGAQKAENLPSETLNGEVYGVARWTLAMTAVKAGELELGPAELQTIYTVEPTGRRRSRGDPFFDSFFGRVEQRQFNFVSDPLKLRVLPPPAAGKPPTFNGAVGRFRLEVAASPTNVAAGDPVTVRVKVTGQGNFDGLRLPELPAGSGFQAYPGTNSFVEGDPLGLSGTKTFELVVVPEQSGIQKLHWPVLSFWDPGERRYFTDDPRPLLINVRPGTTPQAQPAGSNLVTGPATAPSVPVPAGDLILKNEIGPLISLTPPLVTLGWFWTALGLPLAVYASMVLAGTVKRRRREDPAVAARNRARHLVTEAAVNLAEHARTGRGPEFFAALNAALQGQLALTLGGAPGTYTEDVIDTKLAPRGLPPDEAERLRRLFGVMTQARFAPVSAAGELAEWRREADAALAALRRLEEAR